MAQYDFDFRDIHDRAAFQEIVRSLPPIDRRICRLMLKGYTRQEIGEYVDRSKSTVYRHVKKMKIIFGKSGKKSPSQLL